MYASRQSMYRKLSVRLAFCCIRMRSLYVHQFSIVRTDDFDMPFRNTRLEHGAIWLAPNLGSKYPSACSVTNLTYLKLLAVRAGTTCWGLSLKMEFPYGS